MLETSKDALFLSAALAVALLAIFTAWMIYYVAMILRHANKMVFSLRQKLELVDKILKLVKEKLESSSSHLAILADSAIKLVGYFVSQQKKKKK